MIKFFRGIRQKLLSENKFSKYLLYAIGEIVLVVIGILIALQINTWNEDRKNAANEAHVLNEILNNLMEDQTQIIHILQRRKTAQQAIENLLSILKTEPLDEKDMADNITHFLSFERFYPLNNSFEMMKSNGLLIENKELRTAVSRYYDYEQKKVTQSIKDIEFIFLKLVQTDNAIRSNLKSAGLGTNISASTQLKNSRDPQFLELLETELISFVDNNRTGIIRIEEFKNQNENIIQLVKKELNTARLIRHL